MSHNPVRFVNLADETLMESENAQPKQCWKIVPHVTTNKTTPRGPKNPKPLNTSERIFIDCCPGSQGRSGLPGFEHALRASFLGELVAGSAPAPLRKRSRKGVEIETN